MTTPDPILELTRWLRAHPDGDARLELGRAQVEGLVAEWRRLQQSTDRLRKQNRKVRVRIDRIRAGEPDVGELPGGEPGGEAGTEQLSTPELTSPEMPTPELTAPDAATSSSTSTSSSESREPSAD